METTKLISPDATQDPKARALYTFSALSDFCEGIVADEDRVPRGNLERLYWEMNTATLLFDPALFASREPKFPQVCQFVRENLAKRGGDMPELRKDLQVKIVEAVSSVIEWLLERVDVNGGTVIGKNGPIPPRMLFETSMTAADFALLDVTKPVLYECAECGCLHLWGYVGECEDMTQRFGNVNDYTDWCGLAPRDVIVRTWAEKQAADFGA